MLDVDMIAPRDTMDMGAITPGIPAQDDDVSSTRAEPGTIASQGLEELDGMSPELELLHPLTPPQE